MKAELIKEEVVPVFKPIAITVTIESQDEVNALLTARSDLCVSDIDTAHESDTRYIWVDMLEELAGAIK